MTVVKNQALNFEMWLGETFVNKNKSTITINNAFRQLDLHYCIQKQKILFIFLNLTKSDVTFWKKLTWFKIKNFYNIDIFQRHSTRRIQILRNMKISCTGSWRVSLSSTQNLSVQHKDHTFSAPKCLSLSSTPKTLSSTHPSAQHQKPSV